MAGDVSPVAMFYNNKECVLPRKNYIRTANLSKNSIVEKEKHSIVFGFLTETIWISWQNIKDFSVNLFGFLTVEWGAPPCQSNLLRIFSKSIQWLKRGSKAPASGPHLGFWLTSTAQHQNLKMERLMKKTSSKATISSKESPELQKMLISVVQQIPAEDGAHEEHSPFVPEQGGVRGHG